MLPFVNDFYTLISQDFQTAAPNSQTVDVDISGFNSIIIYNLADVQTMIYFPSGYFLPKGAKFEINGRELENCAGKITVQFINTPVFIPFPFIPYGRLLFIRKKFLIP